MGQVHARQRLVPSPCMECGEAPKRPPHHRCLECWLRHEPMAIQAAWSEHRLEQVPVGNRRSRVPEREWPAGRRWCAGCQSFRRLIDSPGSQCNACQSGKRHAVMLVKTYDITADDYAALLKLQGGRCAICRGRPRSIRLAADHHHRTGVVRGLLCSRCNHDLLGAAHESIEILDNAINYLMDPPSAGNWISPEYRVPIVVDDPPPW